MGATNVETLSPAELEQVVARAGVPDGVAAAEAVVLHLPSAEELERVRWGDPDPCAPAAATREAPRGIS